VLGRKGVLESVEQEFFERRDIGLVLQLRSVYEPGLLESFDSPMDFGRAEGKVVGDDRDRWPVAGITAQFEGHHDILRLKVHGAILYSRFANSEYYYLRISVRNVRYTLMSSCNYWKVVRSDARTIAGGRPDQTHGNNNRPRKLLEASPVASLFLSDATRMHQYQPAPLGSGIASFEIENRALSLFRAERREIRIFTAVNDLQA
jgi:hypothetical protein